MWPYCYVQISSHEKLRINPLCITMGVYVLVQSSDLDEIRDTYTYTTIIILPLLNGTLNTL